MRHALSIAALTFVVAGSVGITSRPALAASTDGASSSQPVLLAQNDSGGPSMFSLLQDIQRLQDQVRNLQGQLDTLQYQLRQNEQGQRDLYENLDKRLNALEGNGETAGNYNSSASGNSGGSPPSGPDSQAQSEYTKAFNELKNGDYDAAISGFNRFLKRHPETSYSDNAWYWLGEANFVKRHYETSLKAFQTVVNRFNNSDKIAASLYKIGAMQAEQGHTDNAKATLKRVIDQYPQDQAAGLARKRLSEIGG